MILRRREYAAHYADYNTSSAAPSSGNATAGHIPQPSAYWRLCGIPHKRHTFTVTTLLDWHRDGADVQARLPLLSAYLGHVDPKSSYWYMTGSPELLALAAARLSYAFGGQP